MIFSTPREIQVSNYLRANRKRLRSIVDVRCRGDSGLLAAVFALRDKFWVWHLGERYSPGQWRDEAANMMDVISDDTKERTGAALDSGDGWSMDGQEPNYVKSFPDSVFELRNPVAVYESHTREQILTAYPFGPSASCKKCRATYVIDPFVIGYTVGEYVIKKSRDRCVIIPWIS